MLNAIIDATEQRGPQAQATAPVVPVLTSHTPKGGFIPSLENVPAIQMAFGLDWKTCRLPLLMQGRAETREVPDRVALVRCDTGEFIDVASSKFKIHNNADIVGQMAGALATIPDARITSGGYNPSTARVIIEAKIGDDKPVGGSRASMGVGDTYGMRISISGGHRPGTPLKARARCWRKVCSNGLTIEEAQTLVLATHFRKLNAGTLMKFAEWAQEAAAKWGQFRGDLEAVHGLYVPVPVQEAALLQVFEPALLRATVPGKANVRHDFRTDAQVLEDVLEADAKQRQRDEAGAWLLAAAQARTDSQLQTLRRVWGLVDSQPGGDMTAGTLAHPLNAVTYYVDHVRGRGDGAAARDSAYDGDGDKLKTRAMRTAVTYAETITALERADAAGVR